MLKFLTAVSVCLAAGSHAIAAQSPAGRGRASMSNQIMTAPRMAGVVSSGQIAAAPVVGVAPDAVTADVAAGIQEAAAVTPETMEPAETIDMREDEKAACLANNIGVGNTFVWASKFSNTNNYASMVEDLEHPENNVCFAKVSLKSNDERISVDDIPAKYFAWGETITCGSWADSAMLKQRILDAKKKNRGLATAAAAVGGAGIGVGIMELGGNKLIGGKVMGQKNEKLSDAQVLRSQMLTLKEKGETAEYNKYIEHLKTLESLCGDTELVSGDEDTQSMCNEYKELFEMTK